MDTAAIITVAQTTTNCVGQAIAYPKGTPEITALLIELPPGVELPWHQHPVPLVGYILSGALTVHQSTGERRVVGAGEVSLESVGIPHRGMNEGTIPCKMIVFVLGLKGLPYTIET